MTDTTHPVLQRLLEHMPKAFDVTLVTLKGQLLVEEQLDDYIDRKLLNAAALHGVQVPFNLKVKLAQALSGPSWPTEVWTATLTLNKIRNSLAHRLDNSNLTGLVEEFLRLCKKAGYEPIPSEPRSIDQDYSQALVYRIGLFAPSASEALMNRKGLSARR
ncbi:hypothetical protein [Stenotrophomonas maltophilia]|uniref:hypothetical protein n=1 Tax=Stenotrophomonas maltophilia TaxID=40324 RepID=UPI002A96DFAC|nr:hypothetical protein [Stenotrophomonas maltophilia]